MLRSPSRGTLMYVDGLFKFGQCKKTAIIPTALFAELLLLAISGPYTKLKVQEGWVTSKYLTERHSVSEFLHGTRKAVPQQHFALLCVQQSVRARIGGEDVVIYYCSLGAWSCPMWEAKIDRELPTWKDAPGKSASLVFISCDLCLTLWLLSSSWAPSGGIWFGCPAERLTLV